MPLPQPSNSASISISITREKTGRSVCEATLSIDGRTDLTTKCQGQSANHALALCLENFARKFRNEAEAEQNIPWNAVDRSQAGQFARERYHVTLHYEVVADEGSKFEALHHTLIGNTVIENAEVTIIHIDPELPVEHWQKGEH
jgi:hypothetical protein